jgi:hypothetical protein
MSKTCCANCVYWEQYIDFWPLHKREAKPYGYCRAVGETESMPDMKYAPDDVEAWAIGSEQDGVLLTRATFFCAMFEEKES